MAKTGATGQKAIDAAGNVGSGLAASALTWLVTTLGVSLDPALAKLLAGGGFVVGVAFALVYRRYAAIVTRRGPHERAAYDTLRESLIQGGLPARIYAERLRATLDAVDRFFGDAGMADRTLWPGAFGLRAPAPLWTAPAFDRCLMLALLYPSVTIMVFWAASGHVGPAERALGLPNDLSGWSRGGAMALLAFVGFGYWRAATVRMGEVRRLAWVVCGLTAGVVAALTAIGDAAITLASIGGVSIVAVDVGFGSGVSLVAFSITLPVALGVVIGVGVIGFRAGASYSSVAFVIGMTVGALDKVARQKRWQGLFQILFLLVMCLTCFGAAIDLPRWTPWGRAGPLLLFFGLFTLINAPFDWASLGVTRALLRRGLELGGWWPYVLALVDAVCAAVIVTALTAVSVLSIQLFDDLAAHSGGDSGRVLPLDPLFDGIAAHPSAPEFWWVYAMLLSTMIPSLVNLTISGASLLRGVPWVTKLLLWLMPERGAPPSFNRPWITLLLSVQVFVGAAIGVIAQSLLAYLVIWWVLPPFGLDLLGLAREVAAPDLPGQAIAAIVGHT